MNSQQPVSRAKIQNSQKAYVAASIVEIVGWVSGVVSILAGLILAFQTEYEYDGDTGKHPYVFAGLGIAISGIIYASSIIMISAYIKSRVVDDVYPASSSNYGQRPIVPLDLQKDPSEPYFKNSFPPQSQNPSAPKPWYRPYD